MCRKRLVDLMYSCLSFQANIGQMDTAKDMWKMIMGNLALIQVTEAHLSRSGACTYSQSGSFPTRKIRIPE